MRSPQPEKKKFTHYISIKIKKVKEHDMSTMLVNTVSEVDYYSQ